MRTWATVALAVWLAACAPIALENRPKDAWNGRMALQIQEFEAHPAQSLNAAFELRGSAQAGTLTLLSPLGTTVAHLQWTPQHAQLEQGGQVQQSASLSTLLTELLGSDLPVAALFDWLHGQESHTPGWQANLEAHAQGRISAQRLHPAPAASLRIVLER